MSFDKIDPTKAGNDQYTYTFVGWSTEANQEFGVLESELGTVTGDVTYYAAFSVTVNRYDVTWKSQDGTVTLEFNQGVPYGSAVFAETEDTFYFVPAMGGNPVDIYAVLRQQLLDGHVTDVTIVQ